MRRDNNTGNNNYQNSPITPPPNITFLSHPPKHHLHFRESAVMENSNLPKHIDSHPRYSQDVTSQPNNAFAHLRNQISNLRSEFTRLIQKDTKQEPEKEVKGSFGLKWEQRPPTHSTMGFYNTGEGSNKTIKDIEGINLKNKGFIIQKLEPQIQIQKKKVKQEVHLRGTKRYSSQLIDKRPQQAVGHSEMAIQTNRIQELQIQIRKLGELKRRAQEQNTLIKKQMSKKQIQYLQKYQYLAKQLEKTKITVNQLNISLSLKNSLFQKMQREGAVSQQQVTKIKQKYQAQIATLQSINRRSLDQVIEKYRSTQQKLQQINQSHRQKDEIFKRMEICLKDMKIENQELQFKLDKLNSVNILQKEQSKRMSIKINEQLGMQRNGKMVDQDTLLKLKQLQDQNVDLRKRVQSYKKTVEQLNANNNSSRQKQLVLKQQCKMLKEQMRKLSQGSQLSSEQVRIKQSLITSLYRDIGILDNQIRHSGHLKVVIAGLGKYIDQLNHKIVTLQCQKLNIKYEGLIKA